MAPKRGFAGKLATVGLLGLLAFVGVLAAGALAPSHTAAAPPTRHLLLAPDANVRPALGTVAITLNGGPLPAQSTPGQVTINFTATAVADNFYYRYTNASVAMIAEIGRAAPYQDLFFSSWAVPWPHNGYTTTQTLETNDSPDHALVNTASWVNPANSWPGSSRYFFEVFVYTRDNASGATIFGATSTLSSNASVQGDTQLIVASHTPWMSIIAPANGSAASPGVQAIVASYGGDFVLNATVNITNGQGQTILDADLTAIPTPDPLYWENHTVIITTTGQLVTPGVYTVTLNEVIGYDIGGVHSWTWHQGFSVSNGTGVPVWVNTTTYNNNSLGGAALGGLGPGATAALLMVVGLIIGMIVGIVLSRMMTPAPAAAPAQPWSGTKAQNECSVCHQSFASEAELKDHQKSAHGM